MQKDDQGDLYWAAQHKQKQTASAFKVISNCSHIRDLQNGSQHSVVYISAVTCIQPHLLLYRAVIIESPYLTPGSESRL